MAKKVYQANLDEFSHLKITSSSNSEKNLLETFHKLDINRANISDLRIKAWFDTDCKDTIEILEWFSQYIDENNVLTSYEDYKHKELCKRNKMLNDKDYTAALSQLMQKKSGILDYEDNCLEIEYLEGELEMCLDTQERLDKILSLNKNLDFKLVKGLKKVNEDEIAHCGEKNKAHNRCIQLCMELDDVHEKLQKQINRFSHHINQYEFNESNFMLRLFSADCDTFYECMIIDSFLRNQCDSKINTTMKSARKRLLSDKNFDSSDDFEILKKRISKSIQRMIEQEALYEATKIEIDFLKNLNIHEFFGNGINESCQLSLESSIILHKMGVQTSLDVINKLSQAKADNLFIKPKVDRLLNIIQPKQQKLDQIKNVDSKVTNIMAYHILLYLFLNKELKDIETTDSFFKNVHFYITTTLHNCSLRIDDMLKVINDYLAYQKIPLEDRLQIFKFQKKILSDECDDSTALVDLIRGFNSEWYKIEQEIFCNDYVNHRRKAKNLENHVAELTNFLANGPTSQIAVLPRSVYDCFDEINNLVNSQATSVKLSVQLINNAEKKLAKSKWFKIRRQLWMMFLTNPNKLLAVINEIELAANEKNK